MDQVARTSRGAKTLRGGILAAAATLVAAVSHMAAGAAAPQPIALGATFIIALPITVALAGRTFSVPRTVAAVAVTQGLFHWLFVWVGVPSAHSSGDEGPVTALPAHAEHLGLVATAAPALLESPAAAESAMWVAHGIAALVTVWMLRRGEQSLRTLQHALFELCFPAAALLHPQLTAVPRAKPVRIAMPSRRLDARLTVSQTISHRGPPEFHATPTN